MSAARRLVLLACAGAAFGLGFRLPRAGLLVLCALAPLWLLASAARPRRAAFEGWFFGVCVWACIGAPGFPQTFARFMGLPAAGGWAAFGVFCAYHGLLYALWAAAVSWTCAGARAPSSSWALPTAVGLSALHFAVLEGLFPMVFPVRVGAALLAAHPPLAQAARLGGPGLPAFAAALCAGALGAVLAGTAREEGGARAVPPSGRPALRALLLAAALVLALEADGLRRLRALDARPASGRVDVVALQSGADEHGAELEALIRLSAEALRAGAAEFLVWPEFDFPARLDYAFDAEGRAHALLAGGEFRGVAVHLMPVPGRVLVQALGRREGAGGRLFNLSFLKAEDGTLAGLMEKTRLVPFGERLPLAGAWPAARRFAPWTRGFTPGLERGPLPLSDGRRVGALICYEDVFPALARERTRRGASVLASMDSAGWFDRAGAELHLRQAALRSVETGRWLLRAVGGGSSAAVDPGGRVAARLAAGVPGALRVRIRLESERTPYVRFGGLLEAAAGLLSFSGLLLGALSRRGIDTGRGR